MLLTGLLLTWACASTGLAPGRAELERGIALLSRPLPGALAALYRMRVAETGGLRLAVNAAEGSGRLVVSKPLGGAVALAAWDQDGSRLFDLERGCEADPEGAARVVGLGILPLSEVPRILGGRLPSGTVDVVEGAEDWLQVRGEGWSCRVRITPHPWRVTALVGPDGTTVALKAHTASVPGRLRIERPDGEWVELELARLEWDSPAVPPPLPRLPPCSEQVSPGES